MILLNKLYFPRKLNFINVIHMTNSVSKFDQNYDVIVVGGGHAGCEAALASASRGMKTLLITLNLDKIGWQPCNPSIGGPGKSTLVHEIDALGGWMGKLTDRSFLHKKILNQSKGPAVWSLRAQIDKYQYSQEMKKVIDINSNLVIREGMVADIVLKKNFEVEGVKTHFGGFFKCTSIVITTGTFLGGTIWVGSKKISAGRAGEMASFGLLYSLKRFFLYTGRLKTGTPPRIDSRYIDYSVLEKQPSESNQKWFSFDDIEWNFRNTTDCYITHTTSDTFSLIRNFLQFSPKYSGFMKSMGPRYCPSIEDKIVRFSEKKKHQIFLEPESKITTELYIQGMSTGFPEKKQLEMIRTIPGLTYAKMVRPAYSVDYDYILATQLDKNLMSFIPGLFFAGQICGTTGYEEAGAQGLIAGLNASLYAENKCLLCMSRDGSFIGTLIDDICTKQIREPYRISTSRSEYRLILRSDNADLRLTPLGRKYNLISDRMWMKFKNKIGKLENENVKLNTTIIKLNSEIKSLLIDDKKNDINKNHSLAKLISCSDFSYENIRIFGFADNTISDSNCQQINIDMKYLNYIERQELHIKNLENIIDLRFNSNINFMKMYQLSKEGREKLTKKRPSNLREACQIGGISVADFQTLIVFLKKMPVEFE